MDQALFIGLLRHILQLGSGYVVTKGILDESSAQTLAGAFLSIGTVAWYAFDKWRARK